jgi:hypothetical protein
MGNNTIRLVTQIDNNLPDNTICLSGNTYDECVKNKYKMAVVRMPCVSYEHVLLLSGFNIEESSLVNEEQCLVSPNIAITLMLDTTDVLSIVKRE